MRLSIVNYPSNLSQKMRTTVTAEDDSILASAREIAEKMNLGRGAMIVSEVLHTDLTNLNNRSYKKKGMEEAVKSFVSPYPTPFIMHHDMGGGGMFGGGDPKLLSIGTNIVANYYARRTETANGLASGYVKVGTFIPEVAKIGETRAIDAIQSRLLFALSIGASITEANYRCSICGKPLYTEECEHYPGKLYEGVKCVAEVYSPVFKEYSAVYSPSDVVAAIKRMDLSEASNPLFATEHYEADTGMDMCEMAIYDLGQKLYPSTDVASNKSTKEEGQTATMEDNLTVEKSQPVGSTTPAPTAKIVEAVTLETASSDTAIVKALELIAQRCEKSDEVTLKALETIKDIAVALGDSRKESKPSTESTPAGEKKEEKPEESAKEGDGSADNKKETVETDTSKEGADNKATSETSSTSESSDATSTEKVDTSEKTDEKPAEAEDKKESDTVETKTEDVKEDTSKETNTTETSSANVFAKRREKLLKLSAAKRGFVKKPGKHF